MASPEAVDDEIVLPGVVGGEVPRGNSGFVSKNSSLGAVESKKEGKVAREELAAHDEELEDVVETAYERLMGLTEMLPDSFWSALKKSSVFSWWLARRSAWVVGSSVIITLLPIFIQQQRLEVEEMQSMQKKQMLLGPSATSMRMP